MGLHRPNGAKAAPPQRGTPSLMALEIDREDGAETFRLTLAFQGQDWTILPGLIEISDPGFTIAFTPATNDTAETIAVSLFAEVDLFEAIGMNVTVACERSDGETSPCRIFAHLAEGTPASLEPLAAHLGLENLPGVHALDLAQLTINAIPSLDLVAFELALAHDWTLDWGIDTLELSDVKISVLHNKGSLEGSATAKIGLLGGTADIELTRTGRNWSFVIEPELDDNATIGAILDGLAKTFGLPNPLDGSSDFEKVLVKSARLEGELGTRDFHFHLEIEGGWSPDWWSELSVKDLSFDIVHSGAGEASGKPSTQVDVKGVLHFGSVAFDLEAEYGGHEDGWTFSASPKVLDDGGTISPGDLDFSSSLGFAMSDIPIDADALEISDIVLSFNTKSKKVDLALKGQFTGSVKLDLQIDVALRRLEAGGFEKFFSGKILFPTGHPGEDGSEAPPLEFDLIFDVAKGSKTFVAAYQNHAGQKISITSILSKVSSDLKGLPDLKFAVRDAFFVADKQKGDKKYRYVFAADIEGGVDLSSLPLISKVMPPGQGIGMTLQPMYATKAIEAKRVAHLQSLLPAGGLALAPEGGKAPSIGAKFHFKTHLRLGPISFDFGAPVTAEAPDPPAQGDPPPGPDAKGYKLAATKGAGPVVKWFPVQKSIGPIHLSSLGLAFDMATKSIGARVDGSLGGGGVTLTALGLGIDYSLDSHRVTPRLDGLGLAFDNGRVAIGGMFLKLGPDEYAGEASIRTSAFKLTALGAYSDKPDYKSLFVYAFLDYPLGGPPFCFVNGIGAGFGHNRAIREVDISEVAEFPFVKQARADKGGPEGPLTPEKAQDHLIEELRSLHDWILPAPGEHFLAVGLTFDTFKIINSFALAILTFGRRFRLDVLGTSTAILPPVPKEAAKNPPPKVAVIDMALKARFDPVESFLGVQAQLTKSSWFLSKTCHLTGGFAFYSWYDGPHSGDFVTSLGGYYPDFKRPAHYPWVPRLGLNWRVSDQVEVKGSAYFALTPNAMMAGGFLGASWHCGGLWATLGIGADFLMQWKPFHYEGQVGIQVSAGYGSLSGSLHASVDLQGPEFAGTAHFKFLFVSFDVDFGADPLPAPPLSWGEFRDHFLPHEAHKIVSAGIREGMVRAIDVADPETEGKLWVINPKELVIATDTLIPVSTLKWGREAQELPADKVVFGVAPMDRPSLKESRLGISLKREGHSAEADFRIEPATKPYAAAMWRPKGKGAGANDGALTHAIGQTTIRPSKPVVQGQTTQVPRRNLRYDPREVRLVDDGLDVAELTQPLGETHPVARQGAGRVKDHIASPEAHSARMALRGYLGRAARPPVRLRAAWPKG